MGSLLFDVAIMKFDAATRNPAKRRWRDFEGPIRDFYPIKDF
jgi:hypothetical protein